MDVSGNNLTQLTNADLKLRLHQFGFPNIPVTETTKPILIKKLQNYLNIERAKLGKAAKYAAQFSSDDESDNEILKNNSEISRFSNSLLKKTITSCNRYMPPLPQNIDISKRTNSNFRIPIVSISNNFTAQKNISKTSTCPPYNICGGDESDSDYNSCKYSTLSNIYNLATDQCISESSRIDTYSDSSPHNKTNLGGCQLISKAQRKKFNSTSCDSDFTRRLLNLRSETLKDSNLPKRRGLQRETTPDLINAKKKNGGSRHEPISLDHKIADVNISPSTAFSNLINKLDEQYGAKQTIIPYLLIGLFSVFFSILVLMYLTITPDLANTLSEKNTRFNYCDIAISESTLHLSSLNCLDVGYLENALEMIKIIVPVLQNRAEEYHCISSAKSYTMSSKEAMNLMQNKENTLNIQKTIRILRNAEYLIKQNPQWNINHVNINGELLNINDVEHIRNIQGIYFAMLHPQLPLLCSIYNKIQKFFCIVGVVGLLVLSSGAIYTGYNIIIIYYKSKREIINYFIEEIINILIKSANDENQTSIFVNHLRDKLIPLHKRNQLEWAWEQAIKYLQENESRLQFEMKIINGEDCRIIKWTDTIPNDHYHQTTQYKKWQSPAFDNANKIVNPPTSCLKIRQMFDKFEAYDPNLKTIIQDAILEKVCGKCKIYDIQLDKQTCCVYVRCASEKDAGIVHNEINGWWFDKRLVSIKFLRIERYLNRFVESSTGPAYLSPSNSKNLSMTQCSKNFRKAEEDYIDITS